MARGFQRHPPGQGQFFVQRGALMIDLGLIVARLLHYAGPPTTLMPRTENAVFYQLFLQNPAAEAGLGRDLRLTFRYQFYTLSGDRPPSADVGGLPPGMMPRKGGFMTDPPSLPAWVTESDIDVYVKEYARSGFHGPLAWCRNIDRGWEVMAPFA